ncbi:MAG: carbohydrate ABC transporter permease [Candidatus Poribacteria bacterium]|nr:carbohydrate ABC transporter permease [Candidatus Poribacteria bacterium]MDP6747583.1 carbohydrate ABC transporter permease [Candidatus Poribacteria bacterium]MDP6998964.1 carbohydrate ABC transporter permease [Candidatus Poribacteria bacterium]
MTERFVNRWIWNLVLGLFAVVMLLPIFWMLVTSLKPATEVYQDPLQILPSTLRPANYVDLFQQPGVPLVRWFWNSVFLAIFSTFLVVSISSLTAFAFARLEFPFRDQLFFLIVAAMVVPAQVTLVPVYIILQKLRWIDTYKALIIPGLAGPFGVFLLRQFFLNVPSEIEEAARIDGCGNLRIFFQIILPLARPALTTLAIFTALGSWNGFFWPLIVTNSLNMRTLPIGLAILNGQWWSEQHLLMAAGFTCGFPIFILYLIFENQIEKGVTAMSFR